MTQYNALHWADKKLYLSSPELKSLRDHTALDETFQSVQRWNDIQKSKYITSLITGMAPSKIILADIKECMSNCVEDGKDWTYFKKHLDDNREFISIDGNNRTIAIQEFLDNKVKVLPGEYTLGDNKGTFVVETNRFNTYSTLKAPIRKYIDENIHVTVGFYTNLTRADLSSLFININDGVELNKQEKRNAILCTSSQIIRDFTKKYISVIGASMKPEVRSNRRRQMDEIFLNLSIYSIFKGNKKIEDVTRNSLYTDGSQLEHQYVSIDKQFGVLSSYLKKFPLTRQSHTLAQLYHLHIILDHIQNNKMVILDDNKFNSWFESTHNRLLGDDTIIYRNKATQKTYTGCLSTTSIGPFTARKEVWLKELENQINISVNYTDSERIFSKQQRYEMWLLQNGKCSVTGKPILEKDINNTDMWAADHITRYADGGKTDVKNGRLIDIEWHRIRGNRTDENTQEVYQKKFE